MKKEDVEYDGIIFRRYPDSKNPSSRIYFTSTRVLDSLKTVSNRERLHRYIWKKEAGKKIPKGYVIHHKDGNSLNNTFSNLECITDLKHRHHHMIQPKRIESSRKSIEKARFYAIKWHKSKEGKKFHSKIGKKSWVNKKKSEKECQFCGEKYQTYFPSFSKFCSEKCKAKNRWRNN